MAIHGTAEATNDVRGEEALETELAQVRELVESGDVEEARRRLGRLTSRWPDAEQVRHFARVLAPPRLVDASGPPGRSLQREAAWLTEHAAEYPGCWLAVRDDKLVAAAPRLAEVLARVHATPAAEGAVLHFEPAEADQP
jgi:cell pole-organizing protein PopZ